jgi:hypothetical protein
MGVPVEMALGNMAEDGGAGRRAPAGRRKRRPRPRGHRIAVSLDDGELARLTEDARRAGMAPGAFAAQRVTAEGGGDAGDIEARRAEYAELVEIKRLLRRTAANVNQAVTKLNATGQHTAELEGYAAMFARHAAQAGDAAERIR